MPSLDSPAVIVARFLRANNYQETLEAFLREANLPPDAGSTTTNDTTIEQILEEKRIFDVSLNFEKLGIEEGDDCWSTPAPTTPTTLDTLPSVSNILSVSVGRLSTEHGSNPQSTILASTADRRLSIIGTDSAFALHRSLNYVQDSPTICFTIIQNRYLLAGGMSGRVVMYDLVTDAVLEERRDHTKYVVKIVTYEDGNGGWVATAGWDGKVFLYRFHSSDTEFGPIAMGNPAAKIVTASNPESMLFVTPSGSLVPLLLLTRRDSTFIYYYELPTLDLSQLLPPAELALHGRQNLAPYSNAWIAFTPCAMSLSPTDHNLLAIATSAIPHMKIILVRLLFPGPETLQNAAFSEESHTSALDSVSSQTGLPPAARQARLAHALQDREASAIQLHCTTHASQTQYSTPALAWRPDGTGLWVNSDDGFVRGIEACSGKVVATLGGHETGSKIRCLWAGLVDSSQDGQELDNKEGGKEWLITGGFDQRLIVWTT